MKKAFVLLLMTLLSALLLTGCWDLTEPEDMSLVTVIGINLTGKNQFEVIVQDQTLNPGGQQIQKSNWTFDIHKSTGATINGALQRDLRTNPEKIYLSHSKAVIVSEELVSQQGIRPVIDFLDRNPEIRDNTLFLISKKGEFEKVFLPDAKLNMDTGKLIEKIIKNKTANSFVLDSKLNNFAELYWGTYTTPYALGIGTTQSFMDNKTIDQGYENVNTDTYDLDVGDIAIFKNGKLAGWLTGERSRGFLWVRGKVEGGSINVNFQGKMIALTIAHMKSDIKQSIKNGKMGVYISVDLEADVGESDADIDFDDKNVIDNVSRALNTQVTKEIREAVETSKSLSADIFEFGNCFFENYPNYWKQHENHWPADYSKLDINIRVTSNIQHIGFVKKPAKTVK